MFGWSSPCHRSVGSGPRSGPAARRRGFQRARVAFVATGVLVLAPSGWSQSDLFVIHGDAAGDTLGQSVDIVGDVNGDGFADVLAGAWRDDDTGTDAGSLRVVSGADGAVLLLLFGDLAGDHLGWGSSGAGDVDGDGRADIAAAADEADVAGISSAGSIWSCSTTTKSGRGVRCTPRWSPRWTVSCRS